MKMINNLAGASVFNENHEPFVLHHLYVRNIEIIDIWYDLKVKNKKKK